LYTLIRPKCIIKNNELLSDALLYRGIEYIEIRSIDINPFSPIGIDENQIRFLDLFLIWCILADSPFMNSEELFFLYSNWNQIILEGRKPGLMLDIYYQNTKYKQSLISFGRLLFNELQKLAEILDIYNNENQYQKTCDKLIINCEYPKNYYI